MTAAQGRSPVTWLVQDNLLLITIDNPPVKALTAELRAGLLDALASVGATAELRGAVLTAAGRHFLAGSDLREFDGPLPTPELPMVLSALDACRIPIAALLHGATLGGGMELALACDVRLAAADTRLGLPEVTLGILPGAGGTQRLPRLIGRAGALDLATSGEKIDVTEALRMGLVDEVLGAGVDPIAAAARALRAVHGRRRLRAAAAWEDNAMELNDALTRAQARTHRYAQIPRIVELICTAAPFDEALRAERRAFNELRASPGAVALRHAMLSERPAARPGRAETGSRFVADP